MIAVFFMHDSMKIRLGIMTMCLHLPIVTIGAISTCRLHDLSLSEEIYTMHEEVPLGANQKRPGNKNPKDAVLS